MATAKRRMNPAQVQPAEAPAPARTVTRPSSRHTTRASASTTEERGGGYVRTTAGDKAGPYYETDREVEVLRATFSEEDPPVYVKVGAGLTINMGNFESLRIDCSVSIPCKRGDIEAAYNLGSDFVAEKINEEQTNWLGNGNAKPNGKTTGKAR